MNAADGPIMEAGNPQSATIAHPAAKDFPRVSQVVPVFPSHPRHIPEVFRLDLAHTKRDRAFDPALQVFFNLVRRLTLVGRDRRGSLHALSWEVRNYPASRPPGRP